jgi:uncharacterized membrane protein
VAEEKDTQNQVELSEEDAQQLKIMEEAVHESIASEELITKTAHKYIAPDTWLDKISDTITYLSGSYYFILGLSLFIFLWMRFIPKDFDPYPYILLNLCISVICVLQTPFVLKNQWRKEEKDRDQSDQDFAVNLKNEISINKLLEQHREFVEIMKKQQKAIEDLAKKLDQK